MAASSSLEDSASSYTDSEATESSTSSESTERAEGEDETEEDEDEEDEDEEVAVPPPAISNSDAEKKKKKPALKPYTHSTSNVYAAASSLLTILGRPLSPTHSKPAAADEILFYNSRDPDFTLPESVKMLMKDEKIRADLPDSDLLKAVHAYAAEFYAAKGWSAIGGRSMDESALLAMGILLEEYCKEMVGKDGDLVFAERPGG